MAPEGPSHQHKACDVKAGGGGHGVRHFAPLFTVLAFYSSYHSVPWCQATGCQHWEFRIKGYPIPWLLLGCVLILRIPTPTTWSQHSPYGLLAMQPGRYQWPLGEMTEETWIARGQHENSLPRHFLPVISQNAPNT